jgi:hypothetical protein
VDSKKARVGIEPGDGLVGRFGDTVVLIPAAAAGSDVAEELLGLIAEVASDPAVPGRVIAARLAGWVIGRMPGDVIAFAVMAPVPDGGVVIFLHGAVWAEVTGPDPARRLSGDQALTWVDQMIPGSFQRLAIGSAGDRPVQAHPRSDLRAGVVPGQGFAVTPLGTYPGEAHVAPEPARDESAEPAPAPAAPVPAPDSAAPAEPPAAAVPAAPPVLAASPAAPVPAQPPVLAASPAEPPPEVPAEPPTDLAPAAQPAVPVPAAPPATLAPAAPTGPVSRPRAAGPTVVAPVPLGALTSDSGPTIPLDRSYAIGREPHNDPLVRSGAASPIVLQDPDHVISRVHAHVSVENGTVTVRDASSTQGTYIARPGASEWTRIGSKPSVLRPGWSMRIGKIVFTFQTSGPVEAR